jgi:hypothetical protein
MTATGPSSVPVTVPVTLPPDFTIHQIAALVRDVAVQLEDMPVILKKHGLSRQQYDSLAGNQFFQNVLQEAVKNWHSPQSTKERVALGALLALEDALPRIAARMTAGREDLADVVETAKLFADLAGIGPKTSQQVQPTGEKFSININLGSDVQQFNTTRPVSSVQPFGEGENAGRPLRPIIEGESQAVQISAVPQVGHSPVPVRSLPEGTGEAAAVEQKPPPETHIDTGLN